MNLTKLMTVVLALIAAISVSCTPPGPNPGEPTPPPAPTSSMPSGSEPPFVSPTPLPFVSSAPVGSVLRDAHADRRSTFDLDIVLDPSSHKLAVTQDLRYLNASGIELGDLVLNAIPDAFAAHGGGVDMKLLRAGGTECDLQPVEGTVHRMELPSPLPPNQTVDVHMEYDVRIPELPNRFGYEGNLFNLGNFIVTPAVYQEDGWAIRPYVDLGDAFYTDIATYNVRIDVPEGYMVAATGEQDGDGVWRAQSVRDFAFCASPDFKILEAEHDGVQLYAYYTGNLQETAQRSLEVAKRSLDLCDKFFGTYPYPCLRMVMNGLASGVSGMEYPMMVMLDREITVEELAEWDWMSGDEELAILEDGDRSDCHEIAHQWFYGIVGNDQIMEAWLDEGMCRFVEYLYTTEYPIHLTGDNDEFSYFSMDERLRFRYEWAAGLDPNAVEDTTDLTWSLYTWAKDDPMSYGDIYDKGGSILYMMYQQMGEDAFIEAARGYTSRFAYSFVTQPEFVEYWGTQGDFSDLFSIYFDR